MSADVIYGIDFKAKTRAREKDVYSLEELAAQITHEMLDPVFYESSLGFIEDPKKPA